MEMTKEQQELFEKQLKQFKTAVNRMNYSEKKKNQSAFNYDIETINKWLNSPVTYEAQLRTLSQYFYNVSALYKLIIRYMALMPTYAYTVIPTDMPDKVDQAKLKKQYMKTLSYIDKMNLPHEMIKAMTIAFREDTFFGYEHEAKDSYFIQPLDAKYCRISSIEDGVYNFAFDFAYFDSFKDELELYPNEFKRKYNTYKETKERWIELDPLKSVCFKVNSDFLYSLPPFATMFQSIVDLDDYKAIKKARAKNDNFMAFIQKIPLDEKNPDINKFLIDLELAMTFHNMASETLPEGVGVITSPMAIEAVKTEKAKTDSDLVSEAYREAFRDGGVSEFLFNSDKNTSVGLAKSILTDEEVVFAMLRQVERWINRKLKNMSGVYNFKIKILDITVFNREEKSKQYLESAQYGIPVILEIGATLGLTPLDFINKVTLENDILGLHDLLTPLQSSHTMKNGEDVGRPEKSDKEISDSGQVNKDKGSDTKRKEG
ncbi:hypothetical protein ACIQ1D_19450 [Lysinibacillus xylanilyticus]|uniref:hypothetical protein n=1 Tax=Lysinibacillus xylanilyticus TaxID=582475 RepID=UPI0038122094